MFFVILNRKLNTFITRTKKRRQRISALVTVLLWVTLFFGICVHGSVMGQNIWSEIAHVPSTVPARWTTIVTTPDLTMHAFWAAASDNIAQGVYGSTYQSIMHSQSYDGIGWSEPIDVVYDMRGIDFLKAITSEIGIHLFWNSDCVHHAMVELFANANNASIWLASQQCVATRSIPEGIAVATDNAKMYLVYSTGDSLALQTSENNGFVWSTPVTVATAQESNGAAIVAYPAIAVWENRVYVVWSASASADQSYQGRGVFFAWSEDGGQNWSRTQQLGGEESGQPTITVSTQGDVHLLWNTRVGVSQRIHRTSMDSGRTWNKENIVFDKNVDGYIAGLQGPPSLLSDKDNGVIALFGTNSGPRLREFRDGSWQETVSLWTAVQGETWATGLVRVGSERVCAYWNAVGSPSMGFSIRCRGEQKVVPVDMAERSKINVPNVPPVTTSAVTPDDTPQPTVVGTTNQSLALSGDQEPLPGSSWTTTHTVLMSTALSVGVIMLVIIFRLRGRMKRL